jgi:hypothetical protein
MDYWLGSIISDYSLYQIIEGLIIILSMVMIFLFIQIALAWRRLRAVNLTEVILQRGSFIRSIIFIFITAIFMLIHELFEGLDGFSLDFTSYEFLELIAFSGLVLFFYEWYKILSKQKKAL